MAQAYIAAAGARYERVASNELTTYNSESFQKTKAQIRGDEALQCLLSFGL